MKLNIHAGHNPSGKVGCGATEFLDESKENRKVLKRVKKLLKKYGVTYYDCTENNGVNPKDILKKICNKEHKHNVDFNISIHLNSGGGYGSEVWLHHNTDKKTELFAKIMCLYLSNVSKKNRGTKFTDNLYVLNDSPKNSILLELCFVDSKSDFKTYSYKKYANEIVNAIVFYWLRYELKRNIFFKKNVGSVTSVFVKKGKRYIKGTKSTILFYKNLKKIVK